MSNYLKEACVESLQQALAAQKNGADQIELCSSLEFDGLTPSELLLQEIINSLDIPIKCMLRHRKGNFVYNHSDLNQLKTQIDYLKKYPIQGIVTGALDLNNNLDISVLKEICHWAYPLPVTIHKCIDIVNDFESAILQLKSIENVKFILTSGGASTAEKGMSQLISMMNLASPEIQIIPAGSITKENLNILATNIKATIYHGKRIVGEFIS